MNCKFISPKAGKIWVCLRDLMKNTELGLCNSFWSISGGSGSKILDSDSSIPLDRLLNTSSLVYRRKSAQTEQVARVVWRWSHQMWRHLANANESEQSYLCVVQWLKIRHSFSPSPYNVSWTSGVSIPNRTSILSDVFAFTGPKHVTDRHTDTPRYGISWGLWQYILLSFYT